MDLKLYTTFVSDGHRMREAGNSFLRVTESCLKIVPELSKTHESPSCGFLPAETTIGCSREMTVDVSYQRVRNILDEFRALSTFFSNFSVSVRATPSFHLEVME